MAKESFNRLLQPDDPAYERYCQRLKADLGLSDEAVEIIVRLRNQMMALKSQLNDLESALESHQEINGHRLRRYREIYIEAEWQDDE